MTVAAAVLPQFVLPVVLTIVLVGAGLVSRRLWLAWCGLALLWVAATPAVGTAALRTLERGMERIEAADAPRADAIVVLGWGLVRAPGSAGMMEWTDPDRFVAGVELALADAAPLLVFTGGASDRYPDAPLEGDVLAPRAVALGVPPERVRTTGRVLNTAQEAEAVAALLAAEGSGDGTHVLLVTSAFHVPRARAVFERQGLRVTPFPVDFQVHADRRASWRDLVPSAGALYDTERSLREWLGRLVYAAW